MNKFTKQCVAAFASLAMAGTLCVAGAVVANTSAWAETQTSSETNAPWNAANVNKKGSIKITKYEDDGTGQQHGTLKGAKFKVTKVNGYDLTKYSDWENLAKKVAAFNKNPNDGTINLGDAVSDNSNTGDDKTLFETNDQGVATISNLGIGLYKVEEAASAPKHANDVAPFFMTIPEITHEAGQPVKYNYDVTVDAKNQSLAGKIKKTLVHGDNETSFVGKGDTMTYKISAAVTSNTGTERSNWTKDDLKGYTVFDQAPANVFTDYTKAVVKSVNLVYKKDNSTKTEPLKDTTTDNTSVTTEEIKEGGKTVATRIKVSFNETGLTAIANAAKVDADAKVEIEFAFTIKDPTQVTETSFTNKSGFIQGQGNNKPAPTPEVPDDKGSTVTSNYGYLQVNKYDGTFKSTDAKTNTSNPKLAGAKFKLFAKKGDADKCAADTAATECGNVSKVGELTTNADGKFDTPVKVVVDSTDHPFYIVETEAPANYERDHQAHVATVSATSTTQDPTSIDIANVPTKDNGSWFKLPKTGAAGVTIFAIAGMGLVGIGIFVFMRNRKKDEEHQNA
ncbi:hypothetical protein AXE77_04290 [Gardnerella vaginalis]|uniref:Peptidase n=1 Tax=Gardnerella vaginalis TaxID=2702 RepID=A0A3E1IZZ6_GARVA|nr:SpaH/EbpB family LPXTG-anchored major pilin [Gardnerella vaginalis]RFD79690.1 hypothetical protein AXE77_04290 [Gardnerella vaginalis]